MKVLQASRTFTFIMLILKDTLARLSLYLLSTPSPSFTPLIKPYLNPRTLPNMLIVILLDWNHPWLWIRQLRDWIRVLRSLIISLDDASKLVLEENIETLKNKGRNTTSEGNNSMEDVKMPLGPGEWDEPLGIPLCVVCQNADKIESLEKERGWKEAEFDFILQYLRTILLKHGSSLIYTMPTAPGSLQTLIHSTLGIKSLLKQEQLRHNVTDRDRVVVPPNWDSWAKIRILRDGFDVEGVSNQWEVDIEIPRHMRPTNGQAPQTDDQENGETVPSPTSEDTQEGPSATSVYEDTIRNPESDYPLSSLSKPSNGVEVTSKDAQKFLEDQVDVLEQLQKEDASEAAAKAARKESDAPVMRTYSEEASGVVEEHIGPVQFNMGGIQVNADEMVKRLQVSHQYSTHCRCTLTIRRIAKQIALASPDHLLRTPKKQARWITRSSCRSSLGCSIKARVAALVALEKVCRSIWLTLCRLSHAVSPSMLTKPPPGGRLVASLLYPCLTVLYPQHSL